MQQMKIYWKISDCENEIFTMTHQVRELTTEAGSKINMMTLSKGLMSKNEYVQLSKYFIDFHPNVF